MSIFEPRTLTCPHCGVDAEHAVAVSINGGRSPQYRQQILDGSFQVIACPTCGKKTEADGPFIYIDLRDKIWIGCFPRAWEPAWRSFENEPLDSWRRSMIDHAPSNVRRMADGFRVRAVFGLPALREKLLCLQHGIDDRLLEALKLDLLRRHEALAMHPAARPLLIDVDGAALAMVSLLPPPESDGASLGAALGFQATWRNVRFSVPRGELDRIRDDAAAWSAAIVQVSGGPYVDLGRMMLSGTARPPA